MIEILIERCRLLALLLERPRNVPPARLQALRRERAGLLQLIQRCRGA